MVSVPSPISKWIKRQLSEGVPSITTESIAASSATVDEAPSGESGVARKTEVDAVESEAKDYTDTHENKDNPHSSSASVGTVDSVQSTVDSLSNEVDGKSDTGHDHSGEGIQPGSLAVSSGRGRVPVPSHFINYAPDYTNEEISRVTVPNDSKVQVWSLETILKGGGRDGNVEVDVYDVDAGQVIASASGEYTRGQNSPLGESSPGNTVTVRITNNSGDAQDVCVNGGIFIVGENE